MNRAALRMAAQGAQMLADALSELDRAETERVSRPPRRRERPTVDPGEVTEIDRARAAAVMRKNGIKVR